MEDDANRTPRDKWKGAAAAVARSNPGASTSTNERMSADGPPPKLERADSKAAMELLWDAALFGEAEQLIAHLRENSVWGDVLLNARRKNGCTAVYMAAEHGRTDALRVLLEAGADATITSTDGASPLFIAAYQNHHECVALLLGAKVDPTAASSSGASPLFMAAQAMALDSVELLIEAGAPLEQAKLSGATPLFIAAQRGHETVLERLVCAKADVNLKLAKSGDTPLITAAERGHLSCVQLLIGAGARTDELSVGELPSDAIGRSVEPATPRSSSVDKSGGGGGSGREGRRGSVGALFSKIGMSASRLTRPSSTDSLHGASALWRAAANGHADVCRELLRAGAEVDASFQGRTPRQSAKFKGHAATVAVFDEEAEQAPTSRKSVVALERSSTGEPGTPAGGGAMLKRNSQVFSGDL